MRDCFKAFVVSTTTQPPTHTRLDLLFNEQLRGCGEVGGGRVSCSVLHLPARFRSTRVYSDAV